MKVFMPSFLNICFLKSDWKSLVRYLAIVNIVWYSRLRKSQRKKLVLNITGTRAYNKSIFGLSAVRIWQFCREKRNFTWKCRARYVYTYFNRTQ